MQLVRQLVNLALLGLTIGAEDLLEWEIINNAFLLLLRAPMLIVEQQSLMFVPAWALRPVGQGYHQPKPQHLPEPQPILQHQPIVQGLGTPLYLELPAKALA